MSNPIPRSHRERSLSISQPAGVPWPPLPAAGAVRRSRRYSLAGRLVSAQALLQRHPGLDVDAWPHLQQACARHDVSAFCLLLGLRTNPAHHGRHWNKELQATARQGPDAYTDLFLPLLVAVHLPRE